MGIAAVGHGDEESPPIKGWAAQHARSCWTCWLRTAKCGQRPLPLTWLNISRQRSDCSCRSAQRHGTMSPAALQKMEARAADVHDTGEAGKEGSVGGEVFGQHRGRTA